LAVSFFNRPTVAVARDLLGTYLVRRYHGRESAAMITEVEAYDGFRDRGSHALRGKTARNAPMFGPPGHWYVYFTYGMHWMLNVVTRERGYPAAVLLRGVVGAAGPARLTKKLHVDKKLNGLSATKKNGLWFEDRGVRVSKGSITFGPRVGIGYAGLYWSRRKWRFWVEKFDK